MSSSTGFLKFRGSTGVGLAHPSTGKCVSIAIAGNQQGSEQIDMPDRV